MKLPDELESSVEFQKLVSLGDTSFDTIVEDHNQRGEQVGEVCKAYEVSFQ